MALEAMDICLRVSKESNKSRFDSYRVRNSLLIISHITFLDCRLHIFFRQPFSKWLYLPRVYFRNWLMRVKWAPFCNFRGALFQERGSKKGGTKSKKLVLFETFHILHGSDSRCPLERHRSFKWFYFRWHRHEIFSEKSR